MRTEYVKHWSRCVEVFHLGSFEEHFLPNSYDLWSKRTSFWSCVPIWACAWTYFVEETLSFGLECRFSFLMKIFPLWLGLFSITVWISWNVDQTVKTAIHSSHSKPLASHSTRIFLLVFLYYILVEKCQESTIFAYCFRSTALDISITALRNVFFQFMMSLRLFVSTFKILQIILIDFHAARVFRFFTLLCPWMAICEISRGYLRTIPSRSN